jgi:hypothetical protein
MKNTREIGFEKEMFLLKDGKIMEPRLFGFPFDCMGFLVEVHTWPSKDVGDIEKMIMAEELHCNQRAEQMGMEIKDTPYMYASGEFVKYLMKTYKPFKSPINRIQNIYGIKESHRFGLFKENGGYRLTSGMHVHFSMRDGNGRVVQQLPVEDIVKRMDEKFSDEIENAKRFKGEWKPKTHGFEYRSLPCNVKIIDVAEEALRILNDL